MLLPLVFIALGVMRTAQRSGPTALHTIRVSSGGEDTEDCWTNATNPCKSIEFAMKKQNLNYTRVSLGNGVHNLSVVVRQRYLWWFSIEGDYGTRRPSINCNSTNAGFYFGYCLQVSLINIKVENCGAEFPSTNIDNSSTVLKVWSISTAIHIEETKNVSFSRVDVTGSFGYGAVFYDVTGDVLMESTNLSHNRLVTDNTTEGYASGGGIYIEFRPKCNSEQVFANSNSRYLFHKCNFINNLGEHRKSVASYSNCKQFISFGRGGGISFIPRGNSSNNFLTLSECLFQGNIALWGAGIFTEFNDKTGTNLVFVKSSRFFDNYAFLGGGALRVGINSDRTKGPNIITVSHSNFTNNTAQVGGGLSYYRTTGDGKLLEKAKVINCTFFSNVADRGAAMNVLLAGVEILNATVNYHRHSLNKERYQGEGAVYFYASTVNFFGQNSFFGNEFTAIIGESSWIQNNQDLTIHSNTGMNGGGMAFYGNTLIFMVPKSTLRLENNAALKKGGALYVEMPVSSQIQINSTQLKMHSCFFLFGRNSTDILDPDRSDTATYFIRNTAPDAFGRNVYADTISNCRRDNEPIYNNSAFKWDVFTYVGSKFKDGRTTVTTNPVIIANVSLEEWTVHPGISFRPSVVLLDENYNQVYGNIRINIVKDSSSSVRVNGPTLFYIKNKIDHIRIDGSPNDRYSVRIETTNGPSVSLLLRDLVLRRCPLGYYHDISLGVCKCLAQKFDIHLGVTKCDIDSSVHILNGRWGDPLITDASGYDSFAVNICPENYCKQPNALKGNEIDHIFSPQNQCAKGRNMTSPLCGSCESGKAVQLGTEDCQECPNNYGIFWLLLLLAFLTLMVLFIVLLNVDTYATSLNAFLYSYQIFPLCTHGNTTLDAFIKIITSVATLSGSGGTGFGVRIWQNMDDLQKMCLNYLIPFYLMLCIFTITKLSFYFDKECFLNKTSSIFRSFVFISVIAYSDFTRITFDLLHPVEIRGQWVVYKAGSVQFLSSEHIPYAILAIFVAVFVVILFPILLIFSHLVIAIPRFDKLRGIFDSFNEPFKRFQTCDVFCTFYFLTRLVLLIEYVFIPQGTLQDTVFAVTCIFIMLIFVYAKPYTTDSMNAYDSILLVNITVLAVVNVGLNGVLDKRMSLQTVAHVLMYVPLLCATVKLVIWARQKYLTKYPQAIQLGKLIFSNLFDH